MSRYQAAALHFLGSASVLFLIFALVRWIWYPGPLFFAASGANLIGIITAVDVVVGPLIMLIIFDVKKNNLKFDVAFILLCQLAFIGFGSWSIFQARPVFIAFVNQEFRLVIANEIEDNDLNKALNPEFKRLPWFGPLMVGTKGPTDDKKREEIMFAGIGGMGLQNLPQYYVPYTEVLSQVKQAARPVTELTKISTEDKQRLLDYQAQAKNQTLNFIPMKSKQRHLYAAIDPKTGAMLGIL
jgi:hypothetical protein